ncbi:MAG TPA: TlpA disulfide reductase family protein [Gaiellaceae bacterium]|nr:TlpA disulfide reductase family protein [Gaiellaceae bacterium]
MRPLRVAAVAVVLGLLGLLVWDVAHQARSTVAKEVDAGKVVPAPPTRLQWFGGGTFDLAAYHGKVVVLNFWASWCPDCKLEAKALHDAAAAWRSNPRVVFVGVDGQDLKSSAEAYMRRYAVDYPVVQDASGAAYDRWGVTGFPETFFVRPDGRVEPPHVTGPITRARIDAAIREALAS